MLFKWETVREELRQEKLLQANSRGLHRFLLGLAIVIGLEGLLLLVVIGGVTVHGDSMAPTLYNNDLAVYNRLTRNFVQGDIVVIQDAASRCYVKRVIAAAGDLVELSPGGGVLVNGMLLSEPYVHNAPTFAQGLPFPLTVPPDQVFVLGDNRRISKDSRSREMGTIPLQEIKGTLLFISRASPSL